MEIENDIALILRAAKFAAEKHRNQRRKDAAASPYINHPLSLAAILAEEGGVTEPTVLAAALLHDTVEDTETTIQELEAQFGKDVAFIVAEVTDDKTLDKAERKRRQVEKVATKSGGAKLVKLADKISNLRDIDACPPADWSDERRSQYVGWATEVVAGLRGVHPGLEAVFDRVAQKLRNSLSGQAENAAGREMSSGVGIWNMTVDKRDLVEAIGTARRRPTLRRVGIGLEPDVVISAASYGLSVRSSNSAMDIAGEGTWASPIRANGAALRRLAPKLSGPTISLCYSDGQLALNQTRVPAGEV